jgi:hypothetical protein
MSIAALGVGGEKGGPEKLMQKAQEGEQNWPEQPRVHMGL